MYLYFKSVSIGSSPAMDNPIKDIIEQKGWCIADGATGSNLFGRGLEAGYPPELWSLERPEEINSLHTEFLQAGA